MNTRFMIWWLAAVIQIIGVGVAIQFGAIAFLLEADQTYLSFAKNDLPWLLKKAKGVRDRLKK